MTDTTEDLDEYEVRETFGDKVEKFAFWLRDEAGAFISSFWMILAFFALGILLLWAFLQVDATFSRPLAGDVINPDVTQNVAWAIRGFSILAGMGMIYCTVNKMPRFARWIGVLAFFAAILLLIHAYGVAAKIMDGQYEKGTSFEDLLETDEQSVSDIIATIEKQKEGWRADTAAVVESNRIAIDNITSDGLDNDEQAAVLQEANRVAQQELANKIANADQKIVNLQIDMRTERTDTKEESMLYDTFNPLFPLMARFSEWNFNPEIEPSATGQYASGIIFFTFFFGLGELLLMSCFPLAYGMQQVAAGKARELRQKTTMRFDSLEEAEAYKKAFEDKQKHTQAVRDGIAKKKEKEEMEERLKVQDQEWALARREQVKEYVAQKMSLWDIATAMGYTYPEFQNTILPRLFSADELEELLLPDTEDENEEQPPLAAE